METEFYFIFDRNEAFKKPFEEEWHAALDEPGASDWKTIRAVTEVPDMRDSPGTQAADMVAWSVNRENVGHEGQAGFKMAHIMRQVLPHFAGVLTKESLMEKYGTKDRARKTNAKFLRLDSFNSTMDALVKANPEMVRKAMEEKVARGVKRSNNIKPAPNAHASSTPDS